MKLLIVDIIEYSDEYFPAFVTCTFVDAFGKTWYINEKAPVVSSDNLTKNTKLPVKGYVAGEIFSQNGEIVCFCTEKPWNIESQDGGNKFYVYKNQIISEINNDNKRI